MKKLVLGTVVSGVLLASMSAQVFASTGKADSSTASISTQILKLLPSQAKLVPSDQKGDLIQSVHLDGDGNTEYAAIYKYSKGDIHNLIGAIIVTETEGKVKELWQYKGQIALVNSGTISVKDLLNNGKEEVVFQGSVGAMADFVDVLAWKNNGVSSVLQTQAYRTDIGQFENSKQDEIATWSLDTGDWYNIQMYGWNSKTEMYSMIPNTDTPNYFKNVVVPYYTQLEQTKAGKQTPRVIDYGLAQAYYNSGEYQQATNEINKGLAINSVFPSNSQFKALQIEVSAKEKNK